MMSLIEEIRPTLNPNAIYNIMAALKSISLGHFLVMQSKHSLQTLISCLSYIKQIKHGSSSIS